jgi:hypothetical protein
MKVFLRHLALAALPFLFGLGASYGFALKQQACGRLVGALFAAKCHGRQLEYQILFQSAATGVGTLVATVVGVWLEHRRRRAVQPPNPTGGPL